MKSLGTNSTELNNTAAAVCSDRKNSCQSACDQLIGKYQTLVGSCNGCDSQSVYEDTLNSLKSTRGQCGSYSANSTSMVAQGLAGDDSSSAGDVCAQQTSSDSGSGSGGGSSKKSGYNTASTSSDACATNPSGPGCASGTGGAASTIGAATDQSLAQLSAAAAAKVEYNVGDSGGAAGGSAGYVGASGAGGAAPNVKPTPNNTGGGIPGGAGGGGGAVPPISGGNGGGGLFGGNAPGVTDIDRGLRSGGYSTAPGYEEKPEALGLAGGRDPSSVTDGAGKLDLKAYLPGGRLSADTLRAAALQNRANGIHPPYINLWTRISDKIQEKCHLGELLDCR